MKIEWKNFSGSLIISTNLINSNVTQSEKNTSLVVVIANILCVGKNINNNKLINFKENDAPRLFK